MRVRFSVYFCKKEMYNRIKVVINSAILLRAMRTRFLFSTILSVIFFAAAAQIAYAVPVRTYGGVNANFGYYSLKSENGGNGNLTPNTSVIVDSYLFQCKSSGTGACSTEHNNDATLVNKWQNYVTVPQLNGSSSQIRHDFASLPYGQCGRLQYDQGVVGIDGAIGGWVYDFGHDCPGASATLAQATTCNSQQQVNTQFRQSGNGPWISGNDLSDIRLTPGAQVDVNCFAKTGTALLEGGVIELTTPNGQRSRASNSPELRNYTIPQSGRYTFTCTSTTISSCSDTDTFVVVAGAASPAPSPVPTPVPTPSPTPRPTPSPSVAPQLSSCDSLQVVGGNNSQVPAKVTLRARGSDNKGNIQAYRFYFGDGTRVETTDPEVTHEYTVSGTFLARVDVKDSVGNYKSSNACEASVYVKSSSVESHKYGCSDLFITADNGAKAPSLVHFTVSGYDNKGDIKGYKLDFGNGVVKESDGRTFEQQYTQAGTYQVRGYIKNNNDQWIGGTDSCSRSLTIGSTKPLYRQPSTGTPTVIPLFGLGSGAAGVVIELARRKFRV